MLGKPTSLVCLFLVGLVAGQTCHELPDTGVEFGTAILVARGTSEPNAAGGKFGIVVGDPVVSNTTAKLPGARGYPVQYPASSSIISGTRQGAADVVARLKAQAAACPNQLFSLVGYSQGASVMHSAASDIPVSLYPAKQVCASGDPTCDNNGDCTYYHLTYIRPEYIDPAVDFIVKGFKG
ncbi:unnamed protein product [Parascedosporium putredinis]|uniref:Cutinase n=1 Tax=Parascedosporium putredinis TaxID=1442378 RepID=A0A9P1H458_9PEZI|nr:unnamed protein product [Parascedosporium putredinis]CAI7996295.1 unnamed protein product [Parascedosporium putredinis]